MGAFRLFCEDGFTPEGTSGNLCNPPHFKQSKFATVLTFLRTGLTVIIFLHSSGLLCVQVHKSLNTHQQFYMVVSPDLSKAYFLAILNNFINHNIFIFRNCCNPNLRHHRSRPLHYNCCSLLSRIIVSHAVIKYELNMF